MTATQETVSTLKHQITVLGTEHGRAQKTVIKISLDDDCKNGHEDFSLTADIYEKDGHGQWRDVGGGCCHDHILKLRPALKPFADLHLSTYVGVPMLAVANAWYWLQGAFPECADHDKSLGACHGGTGSGAKSPEECRRIFADYIRASDAEVSELAKLAPRSQQELQAALEDAGFPARWKKEAQAAIRQLEEWTGRKFETASTRKTWEPLSDDVRQEIGRRRASGYYEPEQIAKRDAEKRAKVKAARLAELRQEFDNKRKVAELELMVEVYLVEHREEKVNAIYYTHTNTLSFNWSSCDRLMSKPEFDAFVAGADLSKLPPDIKFEFKASPRH